MNDYIIHQIGADVNREYSSESKKHFKCKAAAYFYVKFKRVVNYRSNTTTLR